MTACFWASSRKGLRRNTCADRLKLRIILNCGLPKQRPFFFGNAQANSKASSHLDEPSRPGSVPAINILRLAGPQPMTTALIFRRQLVRHNPVYLQQALSASKLPLEKFHRLLDLAFWVKFLKLHIIPYFIFFLFIYRVVLGPVDQNEACGAPLTRPGGGGPQLAVPPRPTISDHFLLCLQCLNCYCLQERERRKFPALPPR